MIVSPGNWRPLNGLVGVIGIAFYPTGTRRRLRNGTRYSTFVHNVTNGQGPQPLELWIRGRPGYTLSSRPQKILKGNSMNSQMSKNLRLMSVRHIRTRFFFKPLAQTMAGLLVLLLL